MNISQRIGSFIQDQVLGMKWLNSIVGLMLEKLGFDLDSRIGESLQSFIYDIGKITILLCTLVFIISYIQSYFPAKKSKRMLGKFKGIWANVIAALLGTVTPFCSSSSIPLFIGFTSAGLPLGVTFSFLISYPMVDLGSLVLLTSIFGIRTGVVYTVLGLIIATLSGIIIEKLKLENQVEEFILKAPKGIDIKLTKLKKERKNLFCTFTS